MARKEKELCIGRKKFNMDPVKVGSYGGLRSRGRWGCTLGTFTLFSRFPQLTQQPIVPMRKLRAQHLVQCPTASEGSVPHSTAVSGMRGCQEDSVKPVMSVDLESLGMRPLFPHLE